jgi:hypothetical protein
VQESENNAYPAVKAHAEYTVGSVPHVVADKAVLMVHHSSCSYLLSTGQLELVVEHNE